MFDLRNGVVHHLLTHFFVWFVEQNGLIPHHLTSRKLIISITTRNGVIPPNFMGSIHDAPPHVGWVVPQTKWPLNDIITLLLGSTICCNHCLFATCCPPLRIHWMGTTLQGMHFCVGLMFFLLVGCRCSIAAGHLLYLHHYRFQVGKQKIFYMLGQQVSLSNLSWWTC
jgi:hypothetical protein